MEWNEMKRNERNSFELEYAYSALDLSRYLGTEWVYTTLLVGGGS